MPELVLLRHGQSSWNRENRFTGWTDVDLTEDGQEQARDAAHKLRLHGFKPTLCFSSYLRRAIRTLWIVQDENDWMWLPVSLSWRLNERHYGALQGRNKAQTAAEEGEEQVRLWRRSFDVRPPPLPDGDPRLPGHEHRYELAGPEAMPRTESLKDTIERTLPFWHDTVAPALRQGETVLIAAHGNSLRGLVKYLDEITDEAIPDLEIPLGKPLHYQLDQKLRAVRGHYLGDE